MRHINFDDFEFYLTFRHLTGTPLCNDLHIAYDNKIVDYWWRTLFKNVPTLFFWKRDEYSFDSLLGRLSSPLWSDRAFTVLVRMMDHLALLYHCRSVKMTLPSSHCLCFVIWNVSRKYSAVLIRDTLKKILIHHFSTHLEQLNIVNTVLSA